MRNVVVVDISRREPSGNMGAENMWQEVMGCPRCKSADTISTVATLARDTRYCFGCRRSFEIDLSGPPQKRLRREDRSNALPSERRGSPDVV